MVPAFKKGLLPGNPSVPDKPGWLLTLVLEEVEMALVKTCQPQDVCQGIINSIIYPLLIF